MKRRRLSAGKVKVRLRFGKWRLVWDDKQHCHYERRWRR